MSCLSLFFSTQPKFVSDGHTPTPVKCDVLQTVNNCYDLSSSAPEPASLDFPKDCLENIFSLMTPQQVAVSACVCRSWASAAKSDLVRISFLPAGFKDLCHRAHPNPLPTANIQETWSAFQEGFLLDGGKHRVRVCPVSGLLSYSASVSACLGVTWGDDSRYWLMQRNIPGAFFLTGTARLIAVCWFAIRGDISCQIPPGTYTVHWRLSRDATNSHWSNSAETQPVSRISVQTEHTNKLGKLPDGRSEDRGKGVAVRVSTLKRFPNWSEVEVGFVEVPSGSIGKGSGLEKLELRVELTATDNDWKSGLLVDALVLRQVAM